MAKRIFLAICLVALIFSLTAERVEAHPRWYGPPWTWGYYVSYYSWHPYYYNWYPGWYDYDYYGCYWEPRYYCCYSPGWYVSFWMFWGFYSYYCYHPYSYWHYYPPPPCYGYYAWNNYHYPDYYWDGHGRWRGNYNDGHKPYRINAFGGSGKEYAYRNVKGNSKPPRSYGKEKTTAKIGKVPRKDRNIEVTKRDPVKSVKSVEKPGPRMKTPSGVEKPLKPLPIKKGKEVSKKEPIEVAYPGKGSEKAPSKKSEDRYKEKEKEGSKKISLPIVKGSGEDKKRKSDGENEKKKVSDKKREEPSKTSFSRNKNSPSNSNSNSSKKKYTSSKPQNRKSGSKGSKKGERR